MRSLILPLLALFIASAASADSPAPTPAAVPGLNAPAGTPPKDPTIITKNEKTVPTEAPLIKGAPFESDRVMGNRKAPVAMIEYASLSCPHCAHFTAAIMPALEEKYVKTGKMSYTLRMFPLNEPALRGAMLLDCVGDSSEEKYYTFARVLFESQKNWAFDGNFMVGLETIAGVGGVSRKQFQNCVNDKDREMKLLTQKKETNEQLKVPYTPYIFIGQEPYKGEVTVEAISKAIDAKLEAAAAKK